MLPLILLPGALCTAAVFKHQIQILANASVKMYSPNADTIEAIAEHLLSTIHGDCYVAGLSMGGFVALEMIKQQPHRVKKLILFNSGYKAELQQNKDRRFAEIEAVQSGQLSAEELIETAYYPLYFRPQRVAERFELNTVLEMAKELGAKAVANQYTALNNRADYTEVLQSVTCPTLIATGEYDTVCKPERHQTMYNLVSVSNNNAELHILKDCAHLSTLENPDKVNQILKQWLAK